MAKKQHKDDAPNAHGLIPNAQSPIPNTQSPTPNAQLTICIITRNAAATIKDTLLCAQKIADEIIVVDTGSTDATQAVVSDVQKNSEKKISFFDFPQLSPELDFAAARNKALMKASGQWVLMLEQDEVLAENDFAKVRTLLQYDGPDAYVLSRRQPGVSDLPSIRLFKNDNKNDKNNKKYRYKYRVFETIEDTLFENKAVLAGVDIFLHAPHETAERAAARKRLYLSILEKECASRPHDPKLFFDRASLHEDLGEQEQALVFFQKAAAVDGKAKRKNMVSQHTSLYYRIAVLLLKAGKREEAEQWLKNSININPGLRQAYLLLAAFYFQQSRPRSALHILVTALRNNIADPELLNMVGFGLVQDSKVPEAVKILEKAKADAEQQHHPCTELVYNNLYTAYLLGGEGDKAIALLEAGIKQYPGTVSFYTNLINLLLQVQQQAKARSYCDQVLKLELEPQVRQQLEMVAKSISSIS